VHKPSRRTDVDWLRVILFAGLIAYHLGLMYAAWSPYALKSDHRAGWVEAVLLTTHPWRMCLLFLLSGIATRFAADKIGVSRLIAQRSVQLLPPLLFGIVFLVPIQAYLSLLENLGYDKGYLAFLPELFGGGHTIVVKGRAVALPVYAHLWFIAYLWIYVGVLALALRFAPRGLVRLEARLERLLSGVGLLMWPLALQLFLRLTLYPAFGINLHIGADWYNHAISLGMFLFGYLLARSDRVWERIEALRWPALAMAAAGWAAYALLWGGHGIPETVERSTPLMHLFYPLERWGAIVAILGFARRHFRRESAAVRYLNGGVFTYYVIHQPALVLLMHHVKPFGLAAPVEAAVVLAGTVAACALAYELARGLGPLARLVGARPSRPWLLGQPAPARQATAS
jgi:hypothetical protein